MRNFFRFLLLSLRSLQLHSHCVPKHLQSMFFPYRDRPSLSTKHRKMGRIIDLHILYFTIVDMKGEYGRIRNEWSKAFQEFNLLFTYSWKNICIPICCNKML